MNVNEKISSCKEKPLLLFSPLDWGLGHTTRCIPIIRTFLNSGCRVVVACNSTQKAVLEPEFPEIGFVQLEGYDLRYSSFSWLTYLFLVFQIPKILIKIKKENKWIRQYLAQNEVDAVISDNRYGFYPQKTPSVFITHQLNIRTGLGPLADKWLQVVNYKSINRFTECWVPDFPGENNAAGRLSHPVKLPRIPVSYLGCLSRFNQIQTIIKYDLLIILSGPEPQRTILENECIKQLRFNTGRSVLVRGLPSNNKLPLAIPGLVMFNHAGADHLNQLICQSKLVISRAGYTTVMDLLKLRKKMILIPTPGQTEQEYLGAYLSQKKLAISISQQKFSIELALKQAADIDLQSIDEDMELYKLTVQQFANKLSGAGK